MRAFLVRLLPVAFGLLFGPAASGQKAQTPAGEAPGPWILGTVGLGPQPYQARKGAAAAEAGMPPGSQMAVKGFAIKVGEHGEAAVAYDLDLCRMVGAWVGKFTTPMNLMSRGEYPTALGEVAFTTGTVAGFVTAELPHAKDAKVARDEPSTPALRPLRPSREAAPTSPAEGAWKDPRPEPFGPLPPRQARFRGFYVNGDKTILKWEIDGVEILEMPGMAMIGGRPQIFRAFTIAAHQRSLLLNLSNFEGDGSTRIARYASEPKEAVIEGRVVYSENGNRAIAWHYFTDAKITEPENLAGDRSLRSQDVMLMPSEQETWFVAAVCVGTKEEVEATFNASGAVDLPEPKDFVTGSPARWPETVVTTGELSKDSESAYVVDTIKLPDPNPWGAPMFVGGFDFFERRGAGLSSPAESEHRAGKPGATAASAPPAFHADAAVCTFHGDVFLVSGLDEKLEKVTWKRFATGLYHALGLKIVNGEIYVTCRDGLWRLHDLNGDGEADFYEAFNFDVKVTKSFHEFVFDLQTDPAGNFYFAKAGPVKNGGRGFDQIMAHHGTLLRVSPDGAKLDVVATGFRAPNGIGVGPRGELTSGDNEGTWTPVCKINWIQPGGFYGVVPLSHRDPLPTSYDPPLCWLPKRVDNSGGSQVWAPEGERWGPWGGKMLHLSYGQAALYGVLMEKCGMRNAERGIADATLYSAFHIPHSELVQGGVTKFPLQFQSGIMRARFSPADGQLYVAGLRGWQTSGLKNGCFQRVRYTGAETRMPIELHVKRDGIELRFAASLDTQLARDPESWHVEQWRYLWSAAYGSPELSAEGETEQPDEPGKDGAPQFTKTQMGAAKHDPVVVKSVAIGTDDRSVFLEIPGLRPVMQMSIKYNLKTAEGKDLRGDVVNTIHALPAQP